jgi:ketosteroid isomerase-like protein
MKTILLVALMISCLATTNGQGVISDIRSLVEVEEAFAKMAKEKNTRDAFLAFFADDVVTVGNEPRIGKEYLLKQTPNESWLNWWPVYSYLSASADFGFNTGPWELRNNRSDEKPVAFGHFVTVWKKVNGEWKAAIDMGISHGPLLSPMTESDIIERRGIEHKGNSKIQHGVPEAETEFIKDFSGNGYPSYKKNLLSVDARIYRGGSEPIVSPRQSLLFLEGTTSKPTFDPIDGQTSSARDMAFVYGKCAVDEVLDGKNIVRQSFYLRIWVKEENSWKIALDLIR